MSNIKPVVAIIGRPNVGKSTLFNAIARRNIAIIDDLPGVTRDRNYIDVAWHESSFMLVDTGGFDPESKDDISNLVKEHARMAVDEADVIIMLMDGKDGLLYGDLEIAQILQKTRKPVLYAVNKVESNKTKADTPDFYRLGVETILNISARERIGVSELLEEVCRNIPKYQEKKLSDDETVVAIIGRPNVGKSSLVNRLLGYERALVSKKAGTTRDPVDSFMRYNKKTIRFIDTAGIRRKSRINYSLERYSVFQALRSISRSSLSIFIIDASQGISSQDEKLAAQIYDRQRACILVVNKWDLIEKDTKTHEKFIEQIRSKLAFMDFAPIVTVSALTGFRVRKILDSIGEIESTYLKRVQTSRLNSEIQDICRRKTPPRGPNGRTKIYYATQVAKGPPTFKLFTNNPGAFPLHYRKYLERSIRERFSLDGSPICLQFSGRHNT